MSIKEKQDKIKGGEIIEDYSLVPTELGVWSRFERPVLISVILALIALFAFGLGRASVIYQNNEPIKIQQNNQVINSSNNSKAIYAVTPSMGNRGDRVYASKSGAKYYFENCNSNVKEENKVWFATAQLAESAGLSLATNCK